MVGKVGSVEVGPPAKKGEGRTRRYYATPDRLVTQPADDIVVVPDILEYAARTRPDKPLFGWRDTIKMHNEEKEITKTVKGKEIKEMKKWRYYELSDYKWWNTKEVLDRCQAVGSGLRQLGITNEQKFNIYASTHAHWQLVAQGCCIHGITFATAYDSLGESGLEHSLNEPECVGVFTNAALLGTLAAVVGKTPTVKTIIYDGSIDEDPKFGQALEKLKGIKQGEESLQILSLTELIELGNKHKHEPVRPKPETIACIMYTSGSTGAPKGVILTHANIVASVGAVRTLLIDVFRPVDTFIAFLPLAHILEFVAEMAMIYIGLSMGYGKIATLTDTSVRNCVGDIRALKPTCMVGVPAVWELIRKGIVGKVKAGGGLKEKMFYGALAAKQANKTLFGGITDAVVFSKVKQQTGGRLRYVLSGGAPISRDTQAFLSTALVTVLQGYGLTESCGMTAILHPDFMQYGSVGVPVPSMEVKLVDIEETKYFSSNNPPQGEVWVRGNSLTQGYYKREEQTKKDFTEDGWFMTGDVGQWNADGTLSIIDRKKNLVKLSGGEYIAIERLEATYKSCPLVSNMCVHADPDAKQPMAIVCSHEANLKSFCASNGHGGKDEDINHLVTVDAVRDDVLKELNAIGKKTGFKSLEMLQCIVLVADEWTPQSGLLTAAQKLQRKAIVERYKEKIDKVYP
ncbi:uncharacterized protein L969DRAFT_94983 [Mixia osmundae IAM 14324]|uniref:AMP-dependent synthetase/ligase domain-containing protein n=1 Tax=Mixia osmundae (strain CBS 9802 / IAM 14324 / JCM 22182 / KY 12970) TaxID=764103 RepID=G7E143_MIXOS|nr:uncharacterized protein L969DRAFT_94983 [Mixia osmundae IAM 14324]KEI38807.1 hypothetical protein L969DRAFT_94983 [Mixia osmundae IAM 14324]GAA96553.1 hypothetical protein E5Q_03222 [Mixia osmundae IAM 14324]